jgi:hypothetical protein
MKNKLHGEIQCACVSNIKCIRKGALCRDWFGTSGIYICNSMEQRPSLESNTCRTSQEVPCLLLCLKFCYCGPSSLTLLSVYSQMNTVYTLTLCFFKVHYNVILLSMHRSSKLSFPLQIFQLKFCMHLSSLTCMFHALPISSSFI